MVSILVLTLNEEKNLAACLSAVSWSNDIVVLDSYSTDSTLDIAKAFGARVFQRKLDDWASHQNWANENISFKYAWVYYTDADEIVTPELRDEILRVTSAEITNKVAYRLRYKNYFFGKWIRHCGIYPVWVMRLFKPAKVRWQRLVNPVPVIDGEIGTLQAHFHHFSFNNGLNAWFAKHNEYSYQEAIESIKNLRNGKIDWAGLLSLESARSRRALKELSFRLPFRPALRFLYMYVIRAGFLDGVAGFHYCVLLTYYEYMIVLKIEEIRRRDNALPI